ncbi:MAG: DUF6507 family protein [Pseudoclavibacter sp.]|nr:DUF6507 family protein [Pseudoclavibacter sp.]
MTQWRIDPAGVHGVLSRVQAEQDGLAEALGESAATAVFSGLEGGGVFTAEVPNAVAELLSDQQHNLIVIRNRIGAGALGVMNATISYNRGQEEMVGEFQREMLEASGDGDFSYFEQHGYRGEGA